MKPSPAARLTQILDPATVMAYHRWRHAHDDAYAYDEIFNFVDGAVSRGELLRLMNLATGYAQEGTS